MKKIIRITAILIALVMIFSGCGASVNVANVSKEKDVLKQLSAMKEQGKKPKEMFDYLNQSIKELQKPAATEAVGILVSTLEENESVYNDKLYSGTNPDLMFKYFDLEFDSNKIATIEELELKELLNEITLGGFVITRGEGNYMVLVDYGSLSTFNEYVEDEIKTYTGIMDKIYNEPLELEKRILEMESYILSYNNQQRKEIMTSMYDGYIMIYMSGADNTPVFDYDTGTIDVDMFKVFENAASKYKDNVFGKTISKYVQLLKQEGFINTEKVQDFILNIDSTVNEELSKVEKK